MKRINFTTAKLAKNAGYNYQESNGIYWSDGKFDHEEEYLFYKDVAFPAPYQAELQEWLRNEHGIHIQPTYTSFYDDEYKNYVGYRLNIIIGNTEKRQAYNYILEDEELNLKYNGGILQGKGIIFDTYEDAFEEGLIQGLKIVIDAKSNM